MKRFLTAMFLFAVPVLAAAQQPPAAPARDAQGNPCMAGMKMPGCPEPSAGAAPAASGEPAARQGTGAQQGTGPMTMLPRNFMQASNFIKAIVGHSASGTSAEPVSTPVAMLMMRKGAWMLMFHANVFMLDQQQSRGPSSGPATRGTGGDKFFSTNWLMGMAKREWGPGALTLRAMLSLEPATITQRQYPLLFQQGEAAFGRPIVDGQHPHDLFMELAALYDWKMGERALLSLYAAPVGDPALGPVAYGHRASASENPLAALGHHQEDSTHIAADVVTAGFTYGMARIEASGFHGREPDENRWNINQGAIDSWSTRLTVQPRKNWSAQYSYGRIKSPEALFPSENQERMTASAMYNRALASGWLGEGNWASTVLWGRTFSPGEGAVFNSYLLESTLRFRTRYWAWTRMENTDRSNELLLGEKLPPPGFSETRIGRVHAYTVGFERDWNVLPHLSTGIGAQVTVYGVPASLQGIYGRGPAGVAMFVRLRPAGNG